MVFKVFHINLRPFVRSLTESLETNKLNIIFSENLNLNGFSFQNIILVTSELLFIFYASCNH